MIPTRSTLRAAREEHDRLKGYLPEPGPCRWCTEAPRVAGVSHSICPTCESLMLIEDDYQRISMAITQYGRARAGAVRQRDTGITHDDVDRAHLRLIRLVRDALERAE